MCQQFPLCFFFQVKKIIPKEPNSLLCSLHLIPRILKIYNKKFLNDIFIYTYAHLHIYMLTHTYTHNSSLKNSNHQILTSKFLIPSKDNSLK